MEAYGFKEREEVKRYRKVGSKKAIRNYCNWERAILENYKSIEELSYFINLKAYLNRRCCFFERISEMIKSLWIPLLTLIVAFALVLPSVLIGAGQWQDSLQSETNNTYIEGMIRDGATREEIIHEQVELYQQRVNATKKNVSFAINSLFIIYILILAPSIVLIFLLSSGLNKVNFYKDYISVIDKAIEEFCVKVQSNN